MKKIISMVVACMLPIFIFADLSIGQMETMVEKIKEKRVSKNNDKSAFVSPFVLIKSDSNTSETIIVEPTEKEVDVVFYLGGIVNNRAFINKKWVEVGKDIEGYRLSEIKDNMITLTKNNRIRKIFLKKSKKILKLNEE